MAFKTSKVDLLRYLADVLPETSEFRPGPADAATDPQVARRGRRLTIPLSTAGASVFSGFLFSNPTTQPSPTQAIRVDYPDDELERDVTVYLAWEPTPNATPVTPLVYVLVRWGAGGAVYSRVFQVHRHVAKRFSVTAHYVDVTALYLDGGASAGTTVDLVVAIADGRAQENYYNGIWRGPATPGNGGSLTICPTLLLAASGALVSLPGAATQAYVLFLDKGPTAVGGEPCIPGACSQPLQVGDSFSFSEDEEPDTFADFGLQWVVSSTPDVYTPITAGGTPNAWVAAKLAFGE